ncbi:AEC family transporter [Maridesulfovibrio frigidus]|uniref:AEC family transporter n=1 Tax=Maridesulfovibrio frigidus TaxID=340956 RepID=UPI0004E1DEC6|nr:AEC family transporter [Maridesulfovibrio frigidus]
MAILVATSLIPLFLMIIGGAFTYRKEILPENSSSVLNGFVYYFTLPALLFGTLATTPFHEIARVGYISGYAAAMLLSYLFMFLISKYFFKAHYTESGIRAITASFPNSAYLGIPVMLSLFGDSKEVLIATTLAIILPTLVIILVVAKFSLHRADKSMSKTSVILSITFSMLKTPIIGFALLGIIFSVFNIPLPEFLAQSLHDFGMASVPCALFSIGMLICKQKMKIEWTKILSVNLIKMIIHPVFAAFLFMFFGVKGNMLLMGIVLSGMPSAALSCILAQEYQTLEMETSASVLASMILYMPCLFLTLFIAAKFGLVFQ